MIRVDLPLPETPVTQVKVPSGISALTFFRLLAVAPTIFRLVSCAPCGVLAGHRIWRMPVRYWPVRLAGFAMTSSGVPSATTWPP